MSDFLFNYKRRQWKFGFINIHLYHVPVALQCDWMNTLCDSDKAKGLTWQKWENRLKKLCPVQFWFRQTVIGDWFDFKNNFRSLRDWWYKNVKCRLHPFNVIKIRSLPRTWTDESEVLLHANFEILTKFVECNTDQLKTDDDSYIPSCPEEKEMLESQKKHTREIIYLYEWWAARDIRQKDHDDRLDRIWKQHKVEKTLSGKDWSEQHGRYENDFDNEIEDHLIRLMKIRNFLWS